MLALAKVVARLRAEVVDLESGASMTAVLERAKGVVMAQMGLAAEAAQELLLDRAEQHRRTLLEECWITLGRIRGEAGTGRARPAPNAPGLPRENVLPRERGLPQENGLPRENGPSPFRSDRYFVGGARPAGHRTALAVLAKGLTAARTPDDVAQLLRAALGATAAVGGVMIYAVATAGSLELVGSAGVGDALAEQWSHIPPLSGVAALEAVGLQEALWLDDPERDSARYLLIGDPPERWPSRAWIPVPGSLPMTTVVGFFRTLPGPFDARTRTLLRRAVRLCSGPLRVDGGQHATRPSDEDVAAVQTIFDALTGPAVLLTPLRSGTGDVEDYLIDAATPEAVDVAGRRGKELVGRRILETYPTIAGTSLWEGYLDTLVTGAVHEGDPFTYEEVTAGVPQKSVYSVRASRLGGRLVVSWIRHDTAARETRRLADMQRLGNLGWAGWNLSTGTITWSDQVYVIFDREPALGPMPLEELPRHLVAEDLPRIGTAVRRLLVEGRAVDESFRISTAHGVRHLRIVAEAQRDADGTPVEAHGFFQDLTAQKGTELALRDSERHNLVQRGMLKAERALGARLQDTLLPIPEQSLELADLCVDVAYFPADRGLNVGGDWYSAIELPDRSALFVVGDVAGHGLAAVGTMAQLRFTAKGMAITGSGLPDVLDRLNALLLHTAADERATTATMVMGRYQPWDHRLSWVRAGHLPPLLIRDGEARFLPQPEGCLLGASHGSRYEESELALLPGDHLLLYTDGLVEEPGEDLSQGLDRLAVKALRLLRGGHPMLARTLAATGTGAGTGTGTGTGTGNRDDICVLDIHLPDGAGEGPLREA
ncbi:SpoIIE family protein phosphatase [Streptomyces sp. R-07]|uniref:SpoIIE family protein phosphatase n=1 Tax=Streptomyces sp. R-07 TaxID=3404052 RepID=UPI003CF010C8